MLSTGWPKLRFFCPRLFPAETPQKSPKVAIPATTSRTLRQAARPIGQGVAAPRQQAAAQPWPPARAAPARPKQPGNPGQRTRLDQAHGGTHPAKGWPAARQQQHGPSSTATPGCAPGWIRRTRSTHPAKSWPPERARRGHRLPGKGLPWAGGALRAGAFAAFPKRKKPGARAGRVNRKEGGSGLLAARRRPL